MKRFLFVLVTILMMVGTRSYAAPIGVPGATVGANKSTVGMEVNFLFDRDFEGSGDLEALEAFLKGEIGLNDRVDLIVRLGFGEAEGPGFDTDIGAAFGTGFKASWAAIPDANLKIGSVAQMTQLRAKDNGRIAIQEYDLALGAFLDPARSQRSGEVTFLPYGGIAWSGIDLQGIGAEENVFGFFAGLSLRMSKAVQVSMEVRIPEQTALSVHAAIAF